MSEPENTAEDKDAEAAVSADAVEPETTADGGENPAEGESAEGPRMRARRERMERREAQRRAIALEQARREAKAAAKGKYVEQGKGAGRGKVQGLQTLLLVVLLALIAVGLGSILYFTPLMSVRQTVVTGTGVVTQEDVLGALSIPKGTRLLQIDTAAAADRVASIRRVASARVQCEYPSTLRVTIVERVPVAAWTGADGTHLIDRDGVDFANEPPPPGIPALDVVAPAPQDPTTKAALQVLTSLAPDLARQVAKIAAPSVSSITLTLDDGRTIVWGTTERTAEKAEKLGALLTQPGRTYDVSSPDLPTLK
ncbi:FtsQ-type POTRA domain-containing protein [Mycobacteroides abscessus]|uniref:cell division protein FtsQ/DivIB n=1 Tax=Mycobacteroides abscessus TaxID=36809 RepID=UPI0009A8EEA0|nr:FtsQ-type POTRA domain-containing protein [Mycobacteroides abscessus]MDM2644762.1 FtsQ-type POTRA domain-containing protein [Mycobacteroides abscessus]MDM2654140.1 FtsQ-type POTRA domain-containing protein [Mycobacteroides abscessus]MDM2663313.1 FtsQ-type POTRA domain-containing protein [Mycobacteroides abscessus]MDM2669334.1 FtsQ-type POTRA domain-containing protein [Mycobacteroides abscessus]MDM2674162.1 FtsQ-type POTRA domain-containing protein [Mycobacteroides abscessus]